MGVCPEITFTRDLTINKTKVSVLKLSSDIKTHKHKNKLTQKWHAQKSNAISLFLSDHAFMFIGVTIYILGVVGNKPIITRYFFLKLPSICGFIFWLKATTVKGDASRFVISSFKFDIKV